MDDIVMNELSEYSSLNTLCSVLNGAVTPLATALVFCQMITEEPELLLTFARKVQDEIPDDLRIDSSVTQPWRDEIRKCVSWLR